MHSCLFCKIANKEVPSTIVYEDDTVLAFLDINPVNIGHTLVIPKAHHENLYALPDDILAKMTLVIKKLSIAVKESVSADGINIAMNNGAAAGQVVEHAHIHIIPRHENDGFKPWHGARGYEEGEKESISEKIKLQLQ